MQSGAPSYEELQAENVFLRQKMSQLEQQNGQLAHELAQLKRLVFGTRSERFEPAGGPDQLGLFGGAAAATPPPVEKQMRTVTDTRPKQKPVRQVLPSHLPREVIVIEPEEDVSALKKIGEEVSETLDYRPAKLVVIRRVRPKYVDPAQENRGVMIADLPARPIEKGIAEPGLLAHLLVAKYVDHLPYYRQAQQFSREGITLSESTIGGWGRASVELLAPLYDRLVEQVLQSGYIQADETPIAVQDRKKKGTTHKGYYWVYLAPTEGLVFVDYQEGRGRDGPSGILKGFSGALQSDGYVVYDAYDAGEEISTHACWAHARRNFFEAQGNAPELAVVALTRIKELYKIERELRDGGADADRRRSVRQERAVPLLDDFETWLKANGGLPMSVWGKAVNYALKRWDKLKRYTEDGRIEIDNNLVENAIRPIALGRRNYLFAGSHDAARRGAVIYSLLGTCKIHGVNPQPWLAEVLARISTHPHKRLDELLPHKCEKGKR